jgi:hypothetical protein
MLEVVTAFHVILVKMAGWERPKKQDLLSQPWDFSA